MFGKFVLAAIFCVLYVQSAPYIVISEILKDPVGAETVTPGGKSHEFVEIANLGSDTFFLRNIFLFDGTEADSIIPWATPLAKHPDCRYGVSYLAPGKIGLILDRDYASAPLSSIFSIDSGTVIFCVDDADLGNTLSEDDGVAIFRGTRRRIDTVIVRLCDESWDQTLDGNISNNAASREGTSIIPARFLSVSSNWRYCPTQTSPGHIEKMVNGWLVEWQSGEIKNNQMLCSLEIFGCENITTAWQIESIKGNKSTILQSGQWEPPWPIATTIMLPRDTVFYRLSLFQQASTGVFDILLSSAWHPAKAIRITEHAPRATATTPEWFELANTSIVPISLGSWRIVSGNQSMELTADDYVLYPDSAVAITQDKDLFSRTWPTCPRVIEPLGWISLDNYDDTLILIDNHGMADDTVCWHNEWFPGWLNQAVARTGNTLSGSDAGSWALSSTPTPGASNTDIFWQRVDAPRIDITPTTFTPNGDGVNDRLSINVQLPTQASITISVFGFDGKKYAQFSGVPSAGYVWDGRTSSGAPAPAGPFFVVAEVTTSKGKTILRKRGLLWR